MGYNALSVLDVSDNGDIKLGIPNKISLETVIREFAHQALLKSVQVFEWKQQQGIVYLSEEDVIKFLNGKDFPKQHLKHKTKKKDYVESESRKYWFDKKVKKVRETTEIDLDLYRPWGFDCRTYVDGIHEKIYVKGEVVEENKHATFKGKKYATKVEDNKVYRNPEELVNSVITALAGQQS